MAGGKAIVKSKRKGSRKNTNTYLLGKEILLQFPQETNIKYLSRKVTSEIGCLWEEWLQTNGRKGKKEESSFPILGKK